MLNDSAKKNLGDDFEQFVETKHLGGYYDPISEIMYFKSESLIEKIDMEKIDEFYKTLGETLKPKDEKFYFHVTIYSIEDNTKEKCKRFQFDKKESKWEDFADSMFCFGK